MIGHKETAWSKKAKVLAELYGKKLSDWKGTTEKPKPEYTKWKKSRQEEWAEWKQATKRRKK